MAAAPSLPRFPLFTFSLISPPTVLAAGGQGCDAALNWAQRSEVWGIQKSNDLNTCGVASVAYVLGEVPQQDMALRGSVRVALYLGLKLTQIGDLNKVSLFPSHLEDVSRRTSRDWQAAPHYWESRLLQCVYFLS